MTHLRLEQRYTIACLREQGLGPTAIAKQIGFDKSTVSRELNRNSTPKGYRAQAAQKKALNRCQREPYKVKGALWQRVVERLKRQHSPEQISGRLKKEQHPTLSHEAIYQAVYANKRQGGDLYQHLRRARKKRRKRRDSPRRRGRIPHREALHRVGIEERPVEVETRTEPGHWEADTVVGAEREGALLTLVERQSRLLKVAYLPKATPSRRSGGGGVAPRASGGGENDYLRQRQGIHQPLQNSPTT